MRKEVFALVGFLVAVFLPSGQAADTQFKDIHFKEIEQINFAAPVFPVPMPVSSPRWHLESLKYKTKTSLSGNVIIRAGFYEEAPGVLFRGNILYLEGLGDSMLNHAPLFSTLSKAGYRVIAFDYMGQGGSGGTMNDTRILDPFSPSLKVASLADFVYKKFERPQSSQKRKIVLGWSTGGFAAYEMAHRGKADAVILIAPGICLKTVVGDHFKITLRTLGSVPSSGEKDPHVDPIKPNSPLKVPLFALNMKASSELSRFWKIPQRVKGLVLLSGHDDTYVNAQETHQILSRNAPQFQVIDFPGALHEIDNEPQMRQKLQKDILRFLKQL